MGEAVREVYAGQAEGMSMVRGLREEQKFNQSLVNKHFVLIAQ